MQRSRIIIDASTWPMIRNESLGTKRKLWLRAPDGSPWLFKQVREDGSGARGEDWAEWLVSMMATLLGIPAARIELAVRRSDQGHRRGVLSRQVIPAGHALTHGNELLARRVAGYRLSATGEVPGYTVAACLDALAGFDAPMPVGGLGDRGAPVVFVGYLILDAIVANTDRHHENWAVVQGLNSRPYLAPSFDHGSSLGFQESDQRRERLLEDDRVEAWVGRARTKFEGRPHPVAAALDGMSRLPSAAAGQWRQRVATLDLDAWASAVEQVPDHLMSESARTFAVRIVQLNREALLDGH